MRISALLSVLAVVVSFSSTAHAETYGMYVKAAEQIAGPFAGAVNATEEALAQNGWQVLASYENSVPEGCKFRAHTIVTSTKAYADKIMAHGHGAAFALPLRVGVYEDEQGVNTAFINPASLNRTILGNDIEKQLSVTTMNQLSDILALGAKGVIVNEQIGQLRSKGKIGGMGGGDFDKKIDEMYSEAFSVNAFQATAQKVKEGILANNQGWKLVYALAFGDPPTVIYGVNKADMESKAFKIAGEKRESESNSCPGIDHVSAFPIEVIVYKDGDQVKVATLDGMYRMKLYFEDAGMWAFMKNMRMPGQIQGEIVEMSTSLLKK
jgi:uncharacterized protein (DUF302 family)